MGGGFSLLGAGRLRETGAGVTAGGGRESLLTRPSPSYSLVSKKTRTTGGLAYHLAADRGLQGVHQLGRDPDEVVVVRLDLIVPLQVRHRPTLSFYQLLVELLQHF